MESTKFKGMLKGNMQQKTQGGTINVECRVCFSPLASKKYSGRASDLQDDGDNEN